MSSVLTGRAVIYPNEQVENCSRIDMAQLRKEGILENASATIKAYPHANHELSYDVHYSTQKGGFEETDSFEIVTTPCHFGGVRFWFLCPGCNSRVRILYLPPFRTLFRCRNCHELTYKARQDHRQRLEPLFKCFENLDRMKRLLKGVGQKGFSKRKKRQWDKLLGNQAMYNWQVERLEDV